METVLTIPPLPKRRGGRPPKATHLSDGLTIRFEPETLALLRELAKQQRLAPGTLARMWIMEHLSEHR